MLQIIQESKTKIGPKLDVKKSYVRFIQGTNQSGASDDTDSENLKLGAFASKRDILSRKIGGIAGVKDEVNFILIATTS